MGLLTPLYLAGLAALSLPLVLHLIRRTPRGRQMFSSLMFLTPSPPRLTRRSRLDNLLLLVLRLTILALLALAFARPFLREAAVLPFGDQVGRKAAILLDSSASMRRGDLWQQALKKVEGILDDMGPADDVALMTFDDRLHTQVAFDDETTGRHAGKAALVRKRLASLAPSWGSTDLSTALVTVAGELDTATDVQGTVAEPQLVVISDFARGSRTETLEAYRWPEKVPVVAYALVPRHATNAAAQLLVSDEEGGEPRVRVTNAADSTGDQFFVTWGSPDQRPAAEQPLATYVPAGQSRVLRLPRPNDDAAADRILLWGDEADFDNTFYAVPPQPQHVRVAWFGDDPADRADSARYFFELALGGDLLRNTAVQTVATVDDLRFAKDALPALVVATKELPVEAGEVLQPFFDAGGTLLIVLNDKWGAESLKRLLADVELDGPPIADQRDDSSRAPAGDEQNRVYRMLGEIDFTHPIFAAFANPRYSDFTKIHFWRHRSLKLESEKSATTRVVARFDNGDPAVLERPVGTGRILAFTSGWQPEESQLALSSKFLPLMQAVMDLAAGSPVQTASLIVGHDAPLPQALTRDAIVEKPDGTRRPLAAGTKTFSDADQPGIYRLHLDEGEHAFAVNLAAAESSTAPMPLDSLEQLGVRFATRLTRAERAEQSRQQRDTELESRQHLWRWLIVEALALLVLESWLAGRAARKVQRELA
ncbi:MAG TPA: BatA domain-containing protein [Pirellulales bacterium]|nr:BatA domain-containing protein [Pirellulales bacterium]